MKNLTVCFILTIVSINLISQTHIANVNHKDATANHNQRKIVRDSDDNVYVVFVDWVDQTNVIKGVYLNRSTLEWSEPAIITNGYNPTLVIGLDDEIHLLFESNEPNPQIMYTATSDFMYWSLPCAISEPGVVSKVPVADVNSSGNLNVFWQVKSNDRAELVMYARLMNGEIQQLDSVMFKNEINDIAIANHLLYLNDNLFFAIQSDQDSVNFYCSFDQMESFITVYSTQGSQPCISYNFSSDFIEFDPIRFMYINEYNKLFEVDAGIYDVNIVLIQEPPFEMPFSDVSMVCIDDIAPPLGYSFISLNEYGLVHTFAYGNSEEVWCPPFTRNMEYITGNGLSNPSLAYKHFSFGHVDFIWMNEGADTVGSYTAGIYYMRDAKYTWLGLNDPESGKGFSITGSPNPFADQIYLKITTENENVVPELKIYNLNGQLISVLEVIKINENSFESEWSGNSESGLRVKPGVYIIMVSAGKVHTARKVVFESLN